MGRPKGSKNKNTPVKDNKRKVIIIQMYFCDMLPTLLMLQAEDDVDNSLNTPKHYTSIVTPRPLRQYTSPTGLETEEKNIARPSPRKTKIVNYVEEEEEDEENGDQDDDIEDETYDEIVGEFQNNKKSKVVKKVDKRILENMNIEIAGTEVSDNQFNEITKRSVLKERVIKPKLETIGIEETPRVDVEEASIADGEDPSTDDDDTVEKGNVRIIQLGTEEVKKYAIFNKKEGTANTDEDDDDDQDHYDREEREELYEDEEEAMENDPEAKAYLDNYCEKMPEITTLKVAKKYPSKQKFPCPKCPKIWNWPWELRRHLMIHFKPQKLNTSNSFCCPEPGDKVIQNKEQCVTDYISRM